MPASAKKIPRSLLLLLLVMEENGPERGEIQKLFVCLFVSNRNIFIWNFEKESIPVVEGQGI